jgi:hypothetical protein
MKIIFSLLLVFAQIQTAKPTDKFSWAQDEVSLSVAQSYRYELQLDNITQSKPLVATCTGTISPFTCEAPIPAITPTKHIARVRAVDTSPLFTTKKSAWSDLLEFVMQPSGSIIVTKPAIPGGLTIVRVVSGN